MGLEIEIEKNVSPPPERVRFRDAFMSIAHALAAAGIEAVAVGRPDRLPSAPAQGWSEKDIESLMHDTAQIDLSAEAFALQVLWLSQSNRPGLLGVMFDTQDERPRQSLAVFAGAIRGLVPQPQECDRKLIQTAVHEIGPAGAV